MSGKISAETLAFIRSCFKSVWALELIFVMRRESDRAWSVSDLTRELRASDQLVERILPDFVRKGLVLETARNLFQYRAAAPEIEHLVNRVAAAYAENRIGVIKEIFGVPDNSVQSFADAFKIKKE